MKFLVPIHASGLHSPTETPPLLLEQVKPVSQWVVADADTTGGRALLREAMRRLLEPGCMSRISLLLNPQQEVRFCRYRFCELKYRGAVGRRQVHCTLIVKIIRFYC